MSEPEAAPKKEKKSKKEKKAKKEKNTGSEGEEEEASGADWVFGVKKYRGPTLHKDFIAALYHFEKTAVGKDGLEDVTNEEVVEHYHYNFPVDTRRWSNDEAVELWQAHLKRKKRSDRRRGSEASPAFSEGNPAASIKEDEVSTPPDPPIDAGVAAETQDVEPQQPEPEQEDLVPPPQPEADPSTRRTPVNLPAQPPVPPPRGDSPFARDKSPSVDTERKPSKASEFDLSDSYADVNIKGIPVGESDSEGEKEAPPVPQGTTPSSSAPPTPTTSQGSKQETGEKFTVKDLLERVKLGNSKSANLPTSGGGMKALASKLTQPGTAKNAETVLNVKDSAPPLSVDDPRLALQLENYQRICDSGKSLVTFEEEDIVGRYSVQVMSTVSFCLTFKCYGKVSFSTSTVLRLESPLEMLNWDSRPPSHLLPASSLLTLADLHWPSRFINGSSKATSLPILTLSLSNRKVTLLFSPSVHARVALIDETGGILKSYSLAPTEALKEAGIAS